MITSARVQPFVPVTALPADSTPAPKLVDIPWDQQPRDVDHLVAVRYQGEPGSAPGNRRESITVRNDFFATGERFEGVKGSFADAIRAARELAICDGFDGTPASGGEYGITSVAVLNAGAGQWQLARMKYPEGMRDGMDAIISMPIDGIPASKSDVSVPYGVWGGKGFDAPSRVTVRFNDPRVAALVGRDAIAMPPAAT